jgi:myo-inositol-1(or 4)-monophosphatase
MDIAAGSLIVKEAGGSVTDFEGKENYLNSGRIVASNFSIHDEILKNINIKF